VSTANLAVTFLGSVASAETLALAALIRTLTPRRDRPASAAPARLPVPLRTASTRREAPPPDGGLMSLKEAAVRLSTTPAGVEALCELGYLGPLRHQGRTPVVSGDEVTALVASRNGTRESAS
jgi:hypothetical protein